MPRQVPTFVRLASLALLLYALTRSAHAAAAPEKFVLAHSSLGGAQTILQVMKDHGIFERNGLDVQILFIAGGPIAVKSLLTGDVQAAMLSGPAPILATLSGADAVSVVGLLNTMDHVIISRPGITRPENLRGKTLAVNQIGSGDDFGLRYALRRWGIDPERDVQVLALGGQPARYKALQAGHIDATAIQPPLTAQAREAGFVTLAALADLGLDYQGTCVVTTRAMTRAREDTIRRMVKAFVEAVHFMKTHPAETMHSIGALMKQQDPKALEETYRHYSRLIPPAPYPTVAGVRTILENLATKNPRGRSAKPEDFVEPRFVKELDDAGFIRRLYGLQASPSPPN